MGQLTGDSSNGEARTQSTTLRVGIERSHRVHPCKKLRAPRSKYFSRYGPDPPARSPEEPLAPSRIKGHALSIYINIAYI